MSVEMASIELIVVERPSLLGVASFPRQALTV